MLAPAISFDNVAVIWRLTYLSHLQSPITRYVMRLVKIIGFCICKLWQTIEVVR